MDELEQSVLEKETHDFHDTFNQSAKDCRKAFHENKFNCGILYLVFVIRLGGHMTETYKRHARA